MVGISFVFQSLGFSRNSRISKFSRISRKWTFLKRPLFQKTPFSQPVFCIPSRVRLEHLLESKIKVVMSGWSLQSIVGASQKGPENWCCAKIVEVCWGPQAAEARGDEILIFHGPCPQYGWDFPEEIPEKYQETVIRFCQEMLHFLRQTLGISEALCPQRLPH